MNINYDLLAFGPVPSRRLGKSVGINNIPAKNCSYSCVYCQIGKKLNMTVERKSFYNVDKLLQAVEKKISSAHKKHEQINYITFVSDGEPSLDINLGEEIELFKQFGVKVAVISNASILWRKDVQYDLSKADWVSLKIDTVSANIWQKLNRPHKTLNLDMILQGITDFSHVFEGMLATETMFIRDINDTSEEISNIAGFLSTLNNTKNYISIPTRPPAEKWVVPSGENMINTAYQIFKERLVEVEYLIGYEGNAFAYTGNVENDLLSITAVHPMRKDAVEEFLAKAGTQWDVVDKLIEADTLVAVNYHGNSFYMRKL